MSLKSGVKSKPHLAVFDTFKTRGAEITGEARRQRAIISILAKNGNASERTKTAISRGIATGRGWKNVYSGVFRDIVEVLVPLSLVAEEGRLPLKRGPKALQERGTPYYGLTRAGAIVAMAIGSSGDSEFMLKKCLEGAGSGEETACKSLAAIYGISPMLARHLIEGHVRAYCAGDAGLIPLDLAGQGAGQALPVASDMLAGLAAHPGPKEAIAEMQEALSAIARH